MKKRNLAVVAVLVSACIFGIAYAKSYDVALMQPLAAGSVELPAGAYRLEYSDSTVTLTNTDSGKGYTIPARIAGAETRFKATRVNSDGTVKPEQLKSIELGGSKIRLEFGK